MFSELNTVIDSNDRAIFDALMARADIASQRESIARYACARIRDNIMEALCSNLCARIVGGREIVQGISAWFTRVDIISHHVRTLSWLHIEMAVELRGFAKSKPTGAQFTAETTALIEAHARGVAPDPSDPRPAITKDTPDIVLTSRASQIVRACAEYELLLADMYIEFAPFPLPTSVRETALLAAALAPIARPLALSRFSRTIRARVRLPQLAPGHPYVPYMSYRK